MAWQFTYMYPLHLSNCRYMKLLTSPIECLGTIQRSGWIIMIRWLHGSAPQHSVNLETWWLADWQNSIFHPNRKIPLMEEILHQLMCYKIILMLMHEFVMHCRCDASFLGNPVGSSRLRKSVTVFVFKQPYRKVDRLILCSWWQYEVRLE